MTASFAKGMPDLNDAPAPSNKMGLDKLLGLNNEINSGIFPELIIDNL
jgi:hypothetical protein